ncbi:MAG TPA: hypothetical protein VMB50_05845 [Myxococcales bacterium]|nr:hypothetical protein [Myxococcales bacterium]
MTMGHCAAALIPAGRGTKAPFWLLLVCAQLADLLWLVLALVGVERTEPTSFLDVSILGLRADMVYSHGLVWNLALAVVVAALVFVVLRDRAAALWCGGMVVGHLLLDFVVGFDHEIFGHGSPKLGLGLYLRAPYLAFLIEAVFAALCVAWFVRAEGRHGRPIAARKQALLYAVFVGGGLAFLPTATHSMRQLFSLA